MHGIDRREALKRVAVLLGGAISLPTMTGVLQGCRSEAEAGAVKAFSARQQDLVAAMAEHIIPETDTPGARGVQVDRFIDELLSESYLPEARDRFLAGLDETEARCEARYGKAFLACTPEEQVAFLTMLDEEAFGEEAAFDPEKPLFWRQLKELTLIGYYTSEVGGSQELKIAIMPGYYDGCVPYEEIGRAWSAEV